MGWGERGRVHGAIREHGHRGVGILRAVRSGAGGRRAGGQPWLDGPATSVRRSMRVGERAVGCFEQCVAVVGGSYDIDAPGAERSVVLARERLRPAHHPTFRRRCSAPPGRSRARPPCRRRSHRGAMPRSSLPDNTAASSASLGGSRELRGWAEFGLCIVIRPIAASRLAPRATAAAAPGCPSSRASACPRPPCTTGPTTRTLHCAHEYLPKPMPASMSRFLISPPPLFATLAAT